MENKIIGYCVKCRQKKEMRNTQEIVMKNKRRAIKGNCIACGTKMFRILGK